MSKYYAYIRVSTDKQTLENQKHKILEFAFNKKIQIEDFIEVEVSSKKTQKEREDELSYDSHKYITPNGVSTLIWLSCIKLEITGISISFPFFIKVPLIVKFLIIGSFFTRNDLNDK